MPIKNLLLHIDETKANAGRLQAALALVRACEAHLTGLYVINEFDLPGYAMAQIPRHVIEQQHAAAEQARGALRDLTLIEELRAEQRLTKSTADIKVCQKCHDLDNSPDFDFDTYWPKVEHPWKD